MGRIAIGLPPENLNATITILPESRDFSATQPYTIGNHEAYTRLIESTQLWFDTHRFDLIPTGSNLDPPYLIYEDAEPDWEITDRVVPMDLTGTQHATISLEVNPPGAGTVNGSGTYELDVQVEVTATANAGFYFTGWTENGNQVHDQPAYSFTVARDRVLTANFSEEATDVEEVQSTPGILVFPNPVTNMLYIRASSLLSEIQVLDLSGRLLLWDQPGSASAEISLGHLPAGLYLIRILTSDEVMVNQIHLLK